MRDREKRNDKVENKKPGLISKLAMQNECQTVNTVDGGRQTELKIKIFVMVRRHPKCAALAQNRDWTKMDCNVPRR